MNPPLIAVNDLCFRYGSKPVLELERVVIPAGTAALLGPNGAGKSTLLRILATVAAVPEGTVLVDGADIAVAADRLALRRRLGYASQQDTLPPRMRVAEYCDYVAALKEIGPRRRRRRWTEWILAQVGLEGTENQRISSLSGGMRRRLVLAQSLLGHPEVLILDEPLVSLDAHHRSAMVRLIAASAGHRTTVVATHHSDELAAVCQHVMVLIGGRLAYAGPPGQLAARADGQVWETSHPIDHPSVRALGPDRFRIIGTQPAGGLPAEPTVHDGYLAVLNAAAQPA
jgi:ABC-2 type transport system ATP-binding protein